MARSHALSLLALTGVIMPVMLLFALRALSTPALWAAPAYLLVPEVLLIGLTMTVSVLGLLGMPALLRQVRANRVRGEARVRAERWLLLTLMGGGAQVAWALGVSAFTCS